jgi:hypothetical protein
VKTVCICIGVLIFFSLNTFVRRAGADMAPDAFACNQAKAGILDKKERWVLTKEDVADEGQDHYQLQALSVWASIKSSEYCLRWELENQSPNRAGSSTPTILKNVWWSDVGLLSPRLEPGSGPNRATTWTQREYSSTPIDQNTDVTGAVSSTFKLKAYLPRIKQALNENPDVPLIERVALAGRDHFADIVTGYAEGERAFKVRSTVRTDGKDVFFGIAIESPRSKVLFPFARTIDNARSLRSGADVARPLQSFLDPLDYGTLEVPLPLREFALPSEKLEDRSFFFIVKQPFIVEGPFGNSCLLTSVYSPVRRSFGRLACK